MPIFVDTNYLVALLLPGDRLHERARQIASAITFEQLVTTDFVFVEVLRLMAKMGATARSAAYRTIQRLQNRPEWEVVPASRDLFSKAAELYVKHADKHWDLVDCASLVVMQERGLSEVLTYDHHFEQMGFRALLRAPHES